MINIVISDCPLKAGKIRQALSHAGHECPSSHVLSTESALEQLAAKSLQPDLILFATPQRREITVDAVRQIRRTTPACILVVGPRDATLILDVVRAGGNDYIDEKSDLQNELATALGRLAESPQTGGRQGSLVAVCAASGGSGRTLLATNLAVAVAQGHSRACLLDLDLQGGDAASLLNLKPRHSVCDLCYSIEKLDQKMFEQSLLEHATAVSVLASPERWFDAERLSAEAVQKLLRLSRTLFPHVVADLNSFWLPEYAELLQQSTAVLFLLRLDFAAIRNARRALVHFERIGIDKNKIHVIANFFGQPKEIEESKVESALDMKIRYRIPYDPKTVNLCINCGAPIVIESPGLPIARAIVDIEHALNGGSRPTPPGAAASLEASWQQSVSRIRTLLEDKARAWRTALPTSQFRPNNG